MVREEETALANLKNVAFLVSQRRTKNVSGAINVAQNSRNPSAERRSRPAQPGHCMGLQDFQKHGRGVPALDYGCQPALAAKGEGARGDVCGTEPETSRKYDCGECGRSSFDDGTPQFGARINRVKRFKRFLWKRQSDVRWSAVSILRK